MSENNIKEHEHTHVHENRKQVINRLSRIVGQTEAIKRMYIDEKECSEVLIQIAAAKAALNNVGKIILKDHINGCVVEAVNRGDREVLEKLQDAIDKFMK